MWMTTRGSNREMQNFTQYVTQQLKPLDTLMYASLCLQAACLVKNVLDIYSKKKREGKALPFAIFIYCIIPNFSRKCVLLSGI